jgi:ribokinase
VAARRAGAAGVALVGAVGEDLYGHSSLAGLKEEGIDCRHVAVIAGVPTGVALILVDRSGENCISVAGGANARLTPERIDALPAECFAAARVLVTCLETPLAAVARGLARARQAGLTTILNPAPALAPGELEPLLPLADVLTPNEHEASQLAGLAADSLAGAVAAAGRLQKRGAQDVIVTLGSRGCVVVQRGAAPMHIPALEVTAVDATAAGDAFNGALAVALAEDRSLLEAAAFATAAAGISVTRRGAQPSLPHRQEIDAQHAPAAAPIA